MFQLIETIETESMEKILPDLKYRYAIKTAAEIYSATVIYKSKINR